MSKMKTLRSESDLDQILAVKATPPPTVAIDGVDYPLVPLGFPEIGDLRLWAKGRQDDPFEAIKPHLYGLPADSQRVLIDAALAELRRPIMFGSPEFMGEIQTGEGLREVLWLSLKRAGADVARAASDAAADAMDLGRATDVIVVALGQ